jgi:hypothetical protein
LTVKSQVHLFKAVGPDRKQWSSLHSLASCKKWCADES